MLAANQVWPLLKKTGADWIEDKAMKLAASLALYAMLSLAPMLVIIVKIVGVVYRDETHKVEEAVAGFMPGAGAEAVRTMVENAGKPGGGTLATIISIVIAAFGATAVFGELQDSMNTIWEVKPKPGRGIWGFIRTRFLSFAMVLGLAFLLMVSTVGTTLITTLGDRLSGGSQVIGYILSTVVSLGVMTLLFAGIFKLLPDVKIEWSDVWFGAIFTAVLFEIGKHLLSWYLKGSATEVYGAAASLAALLLWIYYSAQILFFGAELTQAYSTRHGSGIRPDDHAMPMTAEARAQQGMRPKSEAQPAAKAGRRQPQFAGAERQVVTIEQPAVMNRNGYLLAAGGVAAGLLVGAAGVFTGRKYGEPRIKSEEIDERIKAIEAHVGQKRRELRRFNHEVELAQRVAKIEQRVNDATSRVRKHSLRNEWYDKIRSYVG
jgi:membrane protein